MRYLERQGKPKLYEGANPYDLRASFVSLLVWEGRSRATTRPGAPVPSRPSRLLVDLKDARWTSSGARTTHPTEQPSAKRLHMT
jgi:hypothetical protein